MIERQRQSALPVVLDTRVVSGTGGGPDKTILNSPRFLTAAGYRMLCAYMHPPGDAGFAQLRQRAVAWQAPLLSVPDRGPWDWRVATELLRICRRERVRIWHGHDYKSNALGLLLRRRWAEYLTVISTALLLPLEIWEVIRRPHAMRWIVLIINLLVVFYLVIRLRRNSPRTPE